MSHKNKKSLVDQVKQSLDSKLAIGRSKHQDKLSENERKEITSKALGHNRISVIADHYLNNSLFLK